MEADKPTRTPDNRAARLKMKSIERRAGVTHRELLLTGERLSKAIERNQLSLAVSLSHQMTDIDHRLHEAAKRVGVDVAFLRIELIDAKTVNSKLA